MYKQNISISSFLQDINLKLGTVDKFTMNMILIGFSESCLKLI